MSDTVFVVVMLAIAALALGFAVLRLRRGPGGEQVTVDELRARLDAEREITSPEREAADAGTTPGAGTSSPSAAADAQAAPGEAAEDPGKSAEAAPKE